jgi:hypothetical protein
MHMEPEETHKPRRLKRVMSSPLVIWAIAIIALILVCLSATVAFGMGPFRSAAHPNKPSEHMPEVGTDNTPSTLTVIGTDDGDIANMAATTPSTGAAAALQTQDATAIPQSTTSEQSATLGASLNAGVVNLQAGVTSTVNAANLDSLGL